MLWQCLLGYPGAKCLCMILYIDIANLDTPSNIVMSIFFLLLLLTMMVSKIAKVHASEYLRQLPVLNTINYIQIDRITQNINIKLIFQSGRINFKAAFCQSSMKSILNQRIK